MRRLQLQPQDIVLAEDVMEQTYYLGRVDYWLIGRKHAQRFVQRVDGEIRDFYTGTPVIDDGAQLRELMIAPATGRSHHRQRREPERSSPRRARPEISGVLASDLVETIYVGRDGLTKVWRARRPPHRGAAADAEPVISIAQRTLIVSVTRLLNRALIVISPIILARLLSVTDFGHYREFLLYVTMLVGLRGVRHQQQPAEFHSEPIPRAAGATSTRPC